MTPARASSSVLCILPTLVLGVQTADAQVRIVNLQPSIASYEHAFTGIAGVRELADGSLLVSDAGDEQLYIVRAGVREPQRIGRLGAGPAEYRSAGPLWPMRGDTTLFPDPANRRWHLLVGMHIVQTLGTDHPLVRAVGSAPSSVDATGNVLSIRRHNRQQESADIIIDSLVVVRVARTSVRADTVARLRARPSSPPPAGSAAQRNPMFARAFGLPLTTTEQALLFPDGWIALARDNPYRVDWIRSDGARINGATVDEPLVRVDEQERRAYAQRIAARSGRPFALDAVRSWPAVVAPFEEDAMLAAPDGDLVVRRQPTARTSSPRYDVFGRNGQLRRRVELASGARIVGFGDRAVYVATTDEDGLQKLTRHPWP